MIYFLLFYWNEFDRNQNVKIFGILWNTSMNWWIGVYFKLSEMWRKLIEVFFFDFDFVESIDFKYFDSSCFGENHQSLIFITSFEELLWSQSLTFSHCSSCCFTSYKHIWMSSEVNWILRVLFYFDGKY